MAKLEEIQAGCFIKGLLPDCLVKVISVEHYGSSLEIVYKESDDKPYTQLLYQDKIAEIEVVSEGHTWTFEGDGRLFQLLSEAHRISFAYLFDPHLAVTTSLVEPLPHQITAVYNEMLKRQPLRFLLADDPGAGKTVMAGLLIRELLMRGDLQRCLIVCPGSLAEQWQDELLQKFSMRFDILTNDKLEASAIGNWFLDTPLAICRLDKLSRDENIRAKLAVTEWDLIICDEAHKMSASFFNGEINYTKRYKLGQELSKITRHFLLMTATPHNGKETDFQLFMALLDQDRFEGRFRDGVHKQDISDLMRRLTKESLLKFDATPLFPERRAYTVAYKLSELEDRLYKQVTGYVREEFNRAENLKSDDKRKGTVGWALITLQRRLASSPEAIYQSLKRRRERLEQHLREEKLSSRTPLQNIYTLDDPDDLDDYTGSEQEETEERIVDQATAATTIAELEAEISTLKMLEDLAHRVRLSGRDKKWEQLSSLLQNSPEMLNSEGHRRKLVIFTEHRDTLNYLVEKISSLLGKPEAIVIIHGGIGRDERRKAQNAFTQDKDVQILIATDAAGEGINLQRAHLMVNYDLPWNPNRLEQRFGRIHRIGQTEVCHLWNLIASETRESLVFDLLCKKLEEESKALNGQIFDILGQVFTDQPLRKLLIDAVIYGEDPKVKQRLQQVLDQKLDREQLRKLLEESALATDKIDTSQVLKIREEMERADAQRLQPHFIALFFLQAFKELKGIIKEREKGRYEISQIPSIIRNEGSSKGRNYIRDKYERITFNKKLISLKGSVAEFVCPGHPLLDAVIDALKKRNSNLLKTGAILVDETGRSNQVRLLYCLEHSIQDATKRPDGQPSLVSRRMQFVEIAEDCNPVPAGYAPYLDYRPLKEDEKEVVKEILQQDWLKKDFEREVKNFAIMKLAKEHCQEVEQYRAAQIKKTLAAVKDRLTKEITYWDNRSGELRLDEEAGKNPKMNSAKAAQRAEELRARLEKRKEELEREKRLSALPPVVLGGALIVPAALIKELKGEAEADSTSAIFARETQRVERLAMDAVIEAERALGFEPRDISSERRGYDIESRVAATGKLRFIEVKGRVAGAETVTVTKNEILCALNKPEDFILALVEVEGEAVKVKYLRKPFEKEPDTSASSVNYTLEELLARAEEPN